MTDPISAAIGAIGGAAVTGVFQWIRSRGDGEREERAGFRDQLLTSVQQANDRIEHLEGRLDEHDERCDEKIAEAITQSEAECEEKIDRRIAEAEQRWRRQLEEASQPEVEL